MAAQVHPIQYFKFFRAIVGVRADASGTPVGFYAAAGFLPVVALRKGLDFVKRQCVSVSKAAVLTRANQFSTFEE